MTQIGHTEVTQHIRDKYGHRLVTNTMRHEYKIKSYKSEN